MEGFEATGAKNGDDRGSSSGEERLTARWLEPFLWPFVPFSDFPGALGCAPPAEDRAPEHQRVKEEKTHVIY